MCEPASIAAAVMAVTAATSTTMSIISSNNQAEAQTKAANNAAAADYVQQTEEQNQVNQQTAQETMQRAQSAMLDRARLKVAAGEAGIGGLSVAKDIGESYMQQGLDASTLEQNRANHISQIQAEKGSTYATAEGRRNTAKAGTSTGWAAGLQIGAATASAAMQGYGMGKSWQSGKIKGA